MKNNTTGLNNPLIGQAHRFQCNIEKGWLRMGVISMTVITGVTLTTTVASAQTETATTPITQSTDVNAVPTSAEKPATDPDTKTDSNQSQAGDSVITNGANSSKPDGDTTDSGNQSSDSEKPTTDGSVSQPDQKPADATATPTVPAASPAPTATPAPETSTPETPITDYQFTQNGANYTIKGYSGSQTNITLPSQYNGGLVTEIGAGAFNHKNISGTVTIPDSIINIGHDAFANNNITALNLGKSVQTIGNDAFSRNPNDKNSNNSIETVNIPDSVTTIGDRAFANITIKQLTFGDSASASNSKVETIGMDAFSGNQISGTVIIPDTVTTISDRAFTNNKITRLQFGDSDSNSKVETIGVDAFSGNQISGAITIPDSVKSIDMNAFAKNQISTAVLGQNIDMIGKNFFDATTKVAEKDAAGNYWTLNLDSNGNLIRTRLTDYTYALNSNGTYTVTGYTGDLQKYLGNDGQITSLNVPGTYNGKSVTAIGNSAFADKGISTVTIPNTVTYIGNDAFTRNNISTVDLGQGVQIIGEDAFSVNQIGAVKIPDTVTRIGEKAFTQNQIKTVDLGQGVQTIGKDAFSVNPISGLVTIPDSVISIGIRAFADDDISELTLGKNIKIIGEDAFSHDLKNPKSLNHIGSVTIPDSVTRIDARAFANNNISELTLGKGVQIIGIDAFSGNQVKGIIEIPDSVTSIGDRAFADNDMSGLILGNKVQTIGIDAFSRNLTKSNSRNHISGIVNIPDSVTSIGMNAFANNKINALVFGQNIPNIGLYAFDSNDISKITSAKSMVSDQYLSGQQAIIYVPIDIKDVKDNQIRNVKSAIEQTLRAGNTTGFNLGDKLTFTDSVWSYDAATDTLMNHNGQILAHNIIFRFSSNGSGNYGTNELIFYVTQPGIPQSDHSAGVPPTNPDTTTKPDNNTGTVEPPVTPNTPTQSDPNTGTLPPVTRPAHPSDTTGVPSVTNLPKPVRHHTTDITTPGTSDDTTALGHRGHGDAAKQPQTNPATTNQETTSQSDTEQQGTTEKSHTTSQTGEQAGSVEQQATTSSAATAATPSHEAYQQTMMTKQPKKTATAALPQTNEDSSVKPTFIGALLLSILGWFGFARRKHGQD